MDSVGPRGYKVVLRNHHFLALWMAQVLSTIALQGSFFVQLILIAEVTQSSAQLGAVILSFSLPAVLLSALAGLVVDRVSKKYILLASNGLRVLTGAALAVLASLLLTHRVNEALFLILIYALVFLTSAIGQFFAPAEGAMIPLLVGSDNLLPANSLYTLTFIAAQIVGLVILAPLGVKAIGIVGSLWAAVAMYLGATLLITFIPRDRPNRVAPIDGVSAMQRAWNEVRDGWHYALSHRPILVGLLQLALVSTLTMMMAMLAPGFAQRVLGLSAEDAAYVFWPAGAGMFLASIVIGRFGYRMSRPLLASLGMFLMGIALAGLAWAGGGGGPLDIPLLRGHPEVVISATASIMFFSLLVGGAMALINIPAQTVVQEESEDSVRGRVFAVQFTLSNALAIPPLLFVGNLADVFGIPRVTFTVALIIIVLAILNLLWARSTTRLPPLSKTKGAGETASTPSSAGSSRTLQP